VFDKLNVNVDAPLDPTEKLPTQSHRVVVSKPAAPEPADKKKKKKKDHDSEKKHDKDDKKPKSKHHEHVSAPVHATVPAPAPVAPVAEAKKDKKEKKEKKDKKVWIYIVIVWFLMFVYSTPSTAIITRRRRKLAFPSRPRSHRTPVLRAPQVCLCTRHPPS
jgi:hypothetical protein